MKLPVSVNVSVNGHGPRPDWSALKAAILARLDVAAEYRALGVELTRGAPNHKGLIECRAYGRPDAHPSAFINVSTGVYHDSGGAGETLDLFAFALKHGRHGRWIDVVRYYADRAGVDLDGAGLRPGKRGRVREAAYLYHHADGTIAFAVFRYRTPVGKKEFSQHPPDGRGGWKSGPGCMDDVSLVPYRLPELIASQPPPDSGADPVPVWILEGEKDCDRAAALGLVATCNPMGAGKWRDQFNEHFRGRIVFIIPDNDERGRDHARHVATSLHGVARAIKVVELPGLPPKGDLSDWLDAGGTLDELGRIAYAAPLWDPESAAEAAAKAKALAEAASAGAGTGTGADDIDPEDVTTVCLADVRPSLVEWLFPDRIPLGKLTLIAGDPGLGKSFLTMDLIARVTVGGEIPCGGGECVRLGSVVLLSAEDGLADTIRPRLDAAGADVSRVHALTTVRLSNGQLGPFDLSYMGYLEHAIRRTRDVRLVVIDPITSYVGGRIDDHKNAAIRAVLGPLSDLAERSHVAIVLVTHLNKGSGAKALNRITGSLAYAALARAVWLVIKDPEDPARRLFLSVKNNLAPDPSGLAYRIVDSRVAWEPEPVLMTANDALKKEQAEHAERPAPTARIDQAMQWLGDLLSDGEVASEEVFDKGNAKGFRRNMLYDAKARLGIRARKQGFGPDQRWFWALPEPDLPALAGAGVAPPSGPSGPSSPSGPSPPRDGRPPP